MQPRQAHNRHPTPTHHPSPTQHRAFIDGLRNLVNIVFGLQEPFLLFNCKLYSRQFDQDIPSKTAYDIFSEVHNIGVIDGFVFWSL